jgi:predicted ATPase
VIAGNREAREGISKVSKEENLTKSTKQKQKIIATLLPWLERTAIPDCMYEQLLHSYQVYFQVRWTEPKLMKATE